MINRREFLRVLPGAVAAALGSMAAGVAVAKEEGGAGPIIQTVSHSVEMVDYERLAEAVLDAPLDINCSGGLEFEMVGGTDSDVLFRDLMEEGERRIAGAFWCAI